MTYVGKMCVCVIVCVSFFPPTLFVNSILIVLPPGLSAVHWSAAPCRLALAICLSGVTTLHDPC